MTPQTSAYTFLAPPLTVFGWGRRSEIGSLAAPLGRRAFIVWGSQTLEQHGLLRELTEHLMAAGVSSLVAARC
ncbi:MAG TPA: iron-containing alcohol dehydrogenase, partial [Pirellulales bacterium]